MVKFKVKANPCGQYYLPREVRDELGTELDLICDMKAAVIYNSETPLMIVLESLKILMQDLEHRKNFELAEKSEKETKK